jgi:glycosyltransferase involved in cell wall biosynthesis
MNKFKTTLIITSYRRPDALASVFESIAVQTYIPDQVIVADDGSDCSIVEVFNRFKRNLPVSLCWQRDADFRAARARNLAISRVKGEHVIFIDGDCLLPREFVEKHRQLIEPDALVTGGRVLLSEEETKKVLEYSTRGAPVSGGKLIKAPIFPLGPMRKLISQKWENVRTCNLGVWAADLNAVGGFDESYKGWGLEDSDLVLRLHRHGIRNISGRYAATVIHLSHAKESKGQLSENLEKLRNTMCSQRTQPIRSSLTV